MSQFANSSSPYLRLFTASKVEWHNYSDSLLLEARRAKKVIHFSIGSFLSPRARIEQRFYEREDVGEVLNNYFLNVKVDAAESQDLDWLFKTIFTAPNRLNLGLRFDRYPMSVYIDSVNERVSNPNWHFPFDPYSRSTGDIAMWSRNILNEHVAAAATETNERASMLFQFTRKRIEVSTEHQVTQSLVACLERAKSLRSQYLEADQNGSISMRYFLDRMADELLRLWFLGTERTRDETKGLDVLLVGLTKWVRDVGYDHVEGGFYSPQSNRDPIGFELQKPLALNAWALKLLSQAVAISHDRLLSEATTQTADFVLDKLQTAEGGFYAGLLDEENSLQHSWNRRELREQLTEDEYLVIETLYGLDKRANWNGRWMLRRMGSWRSVIAQLFFSKQECEQLLESARTKLKALSSTRREMLVDERKAIGPNAMASSALLLASAVMGEKGWQESVLNAVHAMVKAYKDDATPSGRPSSLIERALLLNACLDALACSWDADIAGLVTLLVEGVKNQIRHETRSLARTGSELAGLLIRMPLRQELGCVHPVDAVRQSLQKYATLFQDTDVFNELSAVLAQGESIAHGLQYGSSPNESYVLDFLYGEFVVVLRGPQEDCLQWQTTLTKEYKPWKHVYYIPYSFSRDLPAYLPRMMSIEDRQRVSAYVRHDLEEVGIYHTIDEVESIFEQRTS